MRPAPGSLISLLADRTIRKWSADLYDVFLPNGTTYHWTTYDYDLTYPHVGGNVYTSQGPFLKRSKWSVNNTLEVPTLTMQLLALNTSFAGGADIKSQIHNGLFDGATINVYRVFMTQPDPFTPPTDTTPGAVLYFGGNVSTIDLDGSGATIKVKGANNKLDQYAPRNLFQIQCMHAFCDAGCTLLRASFTSTFTVGASPTRLFVPWTAPPGTPTLFQLGTLTMGNGPASGQQRTIAFADSTGCTLVYPLYAVPAPGNTFTAFQGCDKTQATCTARSNLQNWRGFKFIPKAETGL